jgi:hypothetical protein
MTPQQFVDELNHRNMPALGYKLITDGDFAYWVWPADGTRYPANETTREKK